MFGTNKIPFEKSHAIVPFGWIPSPKYTNIYEPMFPLYFKFYANMKIQYDVTYMDIETYSCIHILTITR